jgi:ATP-binding cassette subfamily B (MDR/TAP) protein 1
MLMAITQLMHIIPSFRKIASACLMGKKVFDVIERKSLIADNDKPSDSSIKVKDSIKFENVKFRYPTAVLSQPDTFQGISFEIKAGTSTCIVGPSGSGKSSIVQLIERFYEPVSGQILIDETPLKELSLNQLRTSIGYVS